MECYSLCVLFVDVPTDFSSPEVKDGFHRELPRLLRSIHSAVLVVLLVILTQNLAIWQSQSNTFEADWLFHPIMLVTVTTFSKFVSTPLFLANTNFCHKKRHRATWYLSSPSRFWTLTALSLVVGGVDQAWIFDHSGPQSWTQIVIWSVLVFVSVRSVVPLTRKMLVLHS